MERIEFVHPVTLGEGEHIAHEASEALTQSIVPTLDVAGFGVENPVHSTGFAKVLPGAGPVVARFGDGRAATVILPR